MPFPTKRSTNTTDFGDSAKYGGGDINAGFDFLSARLPYNTYNYIVYIDVNDSNKVKARNGLTGDIDYTGSTAFVADVVLNSVMAALTTGSINGGKVYIDRGTYLIGDTDVDTYGFKVGGTSTGPNYGVTIEGAGPSATILKNTVTTTGFILCSLRANVTLKGLTFDGDNLGTSGAVTLVDNRQTANFAQIYNCRFRQHTKHGCFLVNSIIASSSGFIVANNLFELPAGGYDQFPSETYDTGWGGIIANNVFDTSKGTAYAASVTPGASYNLTITGNIFRGIATESSSETIYQGISCEPNGNHKNLVIRNNTFEHRNIQIGAYWPWNGAGAGWNPQTGTQSYLNVTIGGNVMHYGSIRVQGPNDVSYTNSVQNVTIDNNTILDARREGIGCRKIDGPLQIRNNIIRDSNTKGATTLEDGWQNPLPLIELEYCSDTEVTDNLLLMTSSATNKSPAAIGYSNCANPHFLRNRILNETTGPTNPNYTVGSGNTNVVVENWYGSASTTGDFQDGRTINKLAEATTAEKLQTWKVSDDTTSKIVLENALTTDAIFSPRFNALVNGDASTTAYSIIAQIQSANDSGSVPAIIIDGRLATPAALATRPIMDIRNNGTSVFNVRPADIRTTLPFKGFKLGEIAKVTGDSPYTALSTDSIIRIDNSASTTNFVLNLPTAASIAGTKYMIIRTDVLLSTNITVITPNGSETIGGCAVWQLFPGEYLEVESDGTNWQIIHQTYPSLSGYFRQKGATTNRRYIAGQSYGGETALINSTTLPAINTLWALPLIVSKVTKFDTITFKHSTNASAGGVARAGIYRDTGNVYPGALIFDTGSKAVDSGAGTAIDTTITSGLQVFQPGLYWLAFEIGVAAPQILSLSTGNGLLGILGQENTFNTSNRAGYGLSVAHTFGALPDPYTAGATVLTFNPAAATPVPAIGLRPI